LNSGVNKLSPEEVLSKALFIFDEHGKIVNYYLKPPISELKQDEFIDSLINMSSNKVQLAQFKNIVFLKQIN